MIYYVVFEIPCHDTTCIYWLAASQTASQFSMIVGLNELNSAGPAGLFKIVLKLVIKVVRAVVMLDQKWDIESRFSATLPTCGSRRLWKCQMVIDTGKHSVETGVLTPEC